MTEFSINGHDYVAQKMDAIKQSHVARRLAPIMGCVQEAFAIAGRPETFTMIDSLPLMAKMISEMSDANWEYILFACLDLTQRRQATALTRIRVSGRLQFEDIQLPEMMQIVWSVLNDNLAPFFSVLRSSSPKPPLASTASASPTI